MKKPETGKTRSNSVNFRPRIADDVRRRNLFQLLVNGWPSRPLAHLVSCIPAGSPTHGCGCNLTHAPFYSRSSPEGGAGRGEEANV